MSRTPKIGIMQGRLSSPQSNKIQSFPAQTWREEFDLANQAQLSSIEWVYQVDSESLNPLATDDGISQILELANQSGVEVSSVSADYYMMRRLIGTDGRPDTDVQSHLSMLLVRAGALGVRYVMIPFVDRGRLKNDRDITGAIEAIRALLPELEKTGVQLHMETDLPPQAWAEMLEKIDHPDVRVCYDMGDRASCGFNPESDLRMLAPWLGSVHVKDRVHHGESVPVGTGATDFPTCFRLIQTGGYSGAFILQTARETEISELELAIRNRQFVEELVDARDREKASP